MISGGGEKATSDVKAKEKQKVKFRGKLCEKSRGNIADLMSMCIFLIAMIVVLVCFFDCIKLMRVREDISQLARKYTLIAETEGYITDVTRIRMMDELKGLGASDISLDGTTFSRVGFGNIVTVKISGKIDGKYAFSEARASTAKY